MIHGGHSTANECLTKPQEEGSKYQDNADIYHEPCPEMVPEKQDVNAHDGDRHDRKYVNYCSGMFSHRVSLPVGYFPKVVRGGPNMNFTLGGKPSENRPHRIREPPAAGIFEGGKASPGAPFPSGCRHRSHTFSGTERRPAAASEGSWAAWPS